MLQKNTLATDIKGQSRRNEKEHLIKKNISSEYLRKQKNPLHADLIPLQDDPYYPGKAQLALIQRHNDQLEKN